MIIAIDFTASNGMPKHSNSLHFMDPYKPNQYQQAIESIANILLNYDSDKRIPTYGFGAKPHFPQINSHLANHCFPLSGTYDKIEAVGLGELMGMYNNALQNVELA